MGLIAAICVLAGVIWGTLYLRRGSLLAGCVAYLLATAIVSHDFWFASVGPIPITIDRLLIAALAIMFVVHWFWGRLEPKPLAKTDYALIGLIVVLVFSTFTHDWRVEIKGQISPFWRLIVGYLMPATVYLIARQSRLSEKNLRRTYLAMATFGVYLAVTGVLEILGQWSLVFPRHIADPQAGIHFGRARGPMLNSVSYGLALATCMLCGIVVWPRLRRGAQLLLILLSPVFLAALFYSYTRSVWLGTALAIVALMALTLHGRVRIATLGCTAAAGLLIAVVGGDGILAFNRNDNTAAQTRDSVSLRASFAYVSWQMFVDRPLLGVGFGHFPEEKNHYLGDRSTSMPLESLRPYVHHNHYLSLLTEIGAVGLGLFLCVLIGWGRAAWQLAHSSNSPDWVRHHGLLMLAMLSVYAAQLLFHELSYTSLDASLIFFFAGTTMGLLPQTSTARATAKTTAAERSLTSAFSPAPMRPTA